MRSPNSTKARARDAEIFRWFCLWLDVAHQLHELFEALVQERVDQPALVAKVVVYGGCAVAAASRQLTDRELVPAVR